MTSNEDLLQEANDYPETRIETVDEKIHGVVIRDDYRWLENTGDKGVRKWINDQNNHAENILSRIPDRSAIYDRLVQLHDYEEVFLPQERVNGWFYRRRKTDEQQPILYFRSKAESQEKKLIDVNTIDPSGLTSLDYFYPSEDGKLLAYGISKDGSEWSVLHIMEVETGKQLKETIERARYSYVQWKKDKSGFYYTRFPSPGEVPDGEEFYHLHVRYHELGTNPLNDPVIFENKEKPYEIPTPYLSPDESFILISSSSFVANDIFKIDVSNGTPSITSIVTGGKWQIIPRIGENYIYFLSNKDSSKYAVYRAPIDNPLPESWQCIIEPGESILEQFILAGDKIVVVRLHNVTHEMLIYDLEGKLEKKVAIPENSTILDRAGLFSGRIDSDTVYYSHQTFLDPVSISSCNVKTGDTGIFYSTEINVSTENFRIIKKWYPSKDGTKIHMFILQREDTVLDGKNPVILYGYGGFNINLTPAFSPGIIKWLELGGVYIIANLRGGGEFGEEWHDAGKLGKKQNVFDDFIAAGEYLIQEKYCTAKTLGIYGGSNGGLLVGAATVQRPDLWKAVYCGVPLLDMIRYTRFSIAKFWIPEYGDPENPEQFKWLHAYSPYHNVAANIEYPAMFFHTAEADSRVDPGHAMKMAALLQKESISKKPVLLQVEGKAGHGVGKPLKKVVEERTDLLSFMNWQLTSN